MKEDIKKGREDITGKDDLKDKESLKDKKNLKDRDNFEDYKMQVPPEFVPTELGSAVFASVNGSPPDTEFLIEDEDSKDDIKNGAVDSKE